MMLFQIFVEYYIINNKKYFFIHIKIKQIPYKIIQLYINQNILNYLKSMPTYFVSE